MIAFLLGCILCYLIGSIPTGILVVRMLKGVDIRELGSGSSGATNVTRVLGIKYGIFVLLVDITKGFFPAFFLGPWLVQSGQVTMSLVLVKIILGLFAIAGHIWTIFGHFKGGKGVGTGAGVVLAVSPVVTLICIGVWGIAMALTRYVSVSSIVAAVCFPIVVFSFGFRDIYLQIFSIILPLLILFTHRRNIGRLLKKEENRVG